MTSDPASAPASLYGWPAFIAMLGVSLVTMLVAFDQTVVGTALPVIVAELKGFALYSWVATGYLLLSSIFVPIMGRLGDLYGRKSFIMASIVVFTGASALCGMAHSMLQLVAARALQGIGGGMLVGTAFAATADIFPDQLRRIKWQAMLSSAFGLANAIGPSLGGWLTEHWGWRSVFYVNLPVGIVALGVVAKWLPRLAGHRTAQKRLDWTGALLLAASIGIFLLALERGTQGGAAALLGLEFLGPLVGATAIFAAFIWVEQRAPQPILPLHLFAIQAVRLLSFIAACSGWAMFTLIFYAPLLLQAGFGLMPNQAGIVVSPLVVFISVGSIINGRLYGRISGPHRLLGVGALLFLCGCLAVIGIRRGVDPVWLSAAFALCGLGLGFQLPNITIQMQAAVERADVGVVSALAQTLRMLGSMVGAAVSGAVVHALYVHTVALRAGAIDPRAQPLAPLMADPQVLISASARAHALASAVALGLGERFGALIDIARDGLIASVHSALMISVVLSACAWVLARRLPPIAPR